VFEDSLVRLAVLGWCSAPSSCTVCRWLLGADVRKVPLHIAIRSTEILSAACQNTVFSMPTNLPRGVVRPIPLYMLKTSWGKVGSARQVQGPEFQPDVPTLYSAFTESTFTPLAHRQYQRPTNLHTLSARRIYNISVHEPEVSLS
jgi:hypothetical protein